MGSELLEGRKIFYIFFYTGKLDEKLCRTFFVQIAEGLKAMHDCNLAHRDIKPQNVLLTHDFVIKIADFGSSKQFTQTALMRTTRVGTRGYQAPELLLNRGYTKKCDIFALGVLLFVCLTKHPPFKNAVAEDQWFRQIAKKAYDAFWAKHPRDKLSKNCKDLIAKTLCYQPLDRPDMDAILAHPWCKEDVYSTEEMSQVLAKRKKEATEKRNNDSARAPENYDSMTHRAEGGPVVPPAIPFGRDLYVLQTSQHPVLINHGLQKNFELKNRWKATLDDAACRLELEARIKITDPDDWLYEEDKDVYVTVKAEVQGYVKNEGKMPEDFDPATHTGTFYADVRILSEFNEPANVVYNQILNYLGFDHLDEDCEDSSDSEDAE